jgi:hypothetical protein
MEKNEIKTLRMLEAFEENPSQTKRDFQKTEDFSWYGECFYEMPEFGLSGRYWINICFPIKEAGLLLKKKI